MIQMQYQYYLITEIATKNKNAEWWMESLDRKSTVRMSYGFEPAKKALRKTVKNVMKEHSIIPTKSEHYENIKTCSNYGDTEQIFDIVYNIMKDPKWDIETSEADLLDLHKVDDILHLYAFSGSPDLIHIEHEGKSLEMNIHNMDDDRKPYYVTYCERDEEGDVIRKISITMLNNSDAKTKKFNLEYPLSDYETITFGSYFQDEKGETRSPLSWRVLHEENGIALLITEKVVDYMKFSSDQSLYNNWESSDICKWLNSSFYNEAFSLGEKECIARVLPNKIFLLSWDECRKYLDTWQDRKTGFTDYAMRKAVDSQRFLDGPYAGWWLRSASSYPLTDYIREPGECCGFKPDWECGIRPAVWARMDTH